jgi:glucose/arabinose dehydrogenase
MTTVSEGEISDRANIMGMRAIQPSRTSDKLGVMALKNLLPVISLLLLAVLLPSCGGGCTLTSPPPPATLALTTVVSGLSSPLGLEKPPGDNRLFVVQQPGTIRIIANGALLSGNFLDIQSLVNFDGGEQGLLGLAFHPNYSANGKFYVKYTRALPARQSVIAEFQTSTTDPNQADPNSERARLVVNQPFANHKGGQSVLGSDGLLYIGFGDGGNSGTPDPLNSGQDLFSMLGKMLRIGVDPPFTGSLQYAIPADNPFVAGGGLPEIFAYGLCNPWRFSLERGGSRIFVADVGESSWEEVDILQNGGNYGWSVMEGAHCFNPPTGCDTGNKILPIMEYPHTVGIAVIGGYVYTGSAIPSLANKYTFGDLTGKIFSLTEAPANTWTRADLLTTNLTISSLGQDNSGEMYVVDYGGGNVQKLVTQ